MRAKQIITNWRERNTMADETPQELTAAQGYRAAEAQMTETHNRLRHLQSLSVFERSEQQESEMGVLEHRLAEMQTLLPDLERAMVREHQAGDVDQIIAQWGAEGKRQLYADAWAALLHVRQCLQAIVADTARQERLMLSFGHIDTPIAISPHTVLRNMSARMQEPLGWDMVLNGQQGLLPVGLLEEVMDGDPGTKPISRRTFWKILGNVA
jgi:hypothetical protein